MAPKKVSINDVAKHAHVSAASVSYVINGIEKVSKQTKEIILNSIKELDYQPNMMARGLSKGSSKLIGVAFPLTENRDSTEDLFEHNPFFSEFLSGLEKALQEEEYDLLISGLNVQGSYKNWVKRRKLDAVVMLGGYPRSIYEEIKELDIPVVLNDVYADYAKDFHVVRSDDEFGSYLATKHLIDLGHHRIAFASGSVSHSPINKKRYLGYLKALKEAGIHIDESIVYEDLVTFDGGSRIGQKMLQSHKSVTAIHVAADIMALGIMKAFQEAKKDIPSDLSVIGFDDIQMGRFVTPGLTTIKQDIWQKSKVSAEMLMKDLKAGTRTKDSVIIEPVLIERGSVKNLRKEVSI